MKLEIDLSDVHVHIHLDQREAPRWAQTLREMVSRVLANQETIMATMADLEAAVTRNTDVDESVVTLLAGISQQLKDAQADPAKIAEVIAKLDANTQKMAEAVTANTPAA
jgi:hypothetical protein